MIVFFQDPRDAEDAVKALRGKELCGMRVTVQMSKARDERRNRESAAKDRSSKGRDEKIERSRGRGGSRERKRDRSLDRSYDLPLIHI